MAAPREYREQIRELGLDHLRIEVSTEKEAKAARKECRLLQKKLRLMKKEINLDIKEIRADFRDQIANAGSALSFAFDLFGKRRAGGRIRAGAKRGARMDRDETLAPYQELKLTIDDLLLQLDRAKHQMDEYISEKKWND